MISNDFVKLIDLYKNAIKGTQGIYATKKTPKILEYSFGLIGEVGEFTNELKWAEYEKVLDELGDILWYSFTLLDLFNTKTSKSFFDILEGCVEYFDEYFEERDGPYDFQESIERRCVDIKEFALIFAEKVKKLVFYGKKELRPSTLFEIERIQAEAVLIAMEFIGVHTMPESAKTRGADLEIVCCQACMSNIKKLYKRHSVENVLPQVKLYMHILKMTESSDAN